MRAPPVGEVVIDSMPTGAAALGRSGELADVAEIVIGPYHGDVLGQLQAGAVDVQDFLVGAKYLREARGIAVDVPGQHVTLKLDDLLQAISFLGESPATGHPPVVNPTHPDRPGALILCILADARLPVIRN